MGDALAGFADPGVGGPSTGPMSHTFVEQRNSWSPPPLPAAQQAGLPPGVAKAASPWPGVAQPSTDAGRAETHLASSERWGGLGEVRRAAVDIYKGMRQGHANAREWLLAAWGTAPRTQSFSDQWHAATLVDMRVQELVQTAGAASLSDAMLKDDQLEVLLRQLAAAREYRLSGDAEAANHVLGVQPSGASVVPTWLASEARAHSTAMYQQGIRTRGRATEKGDGGKGGGGRGGGRGRASPKAAASSS